MATKEFMEHFGVPEAAASVIDQMLTPQEQASILRRNREPFTPAMAKISTSAAAGRPVDTEEVRAMMMLGYERGYLDLVDERKQLYRVGDFFSFLCVFATREREKWLEMPAEVRQALDEASLDHFVARLRARKTDPPTTDAVVTVEEAVKQVEAERRQLYKVPCIYQHATDGGAVTFCITARKAPCTLVSRYVGETLGKLSAVKLLRRADKDGMVFVASQNGVCACRPAGCFLFRAGEKLGTGRGWPLARREIRIDPAKCDGGGLCAERCPFGVFEFVEAEDGPALEIDYSRCYGCGLCVNTCPTQALYLGPIRVET